MTQPFGGRWLITLARAGDKTRVTIREEGFVKPPIFRVLSKYVLRARSNPDRVLKGPRNRSETMMPVGGNQVGEKGDLGADARAFLCIRHHARRIEFADRLDGGNDVDAIAHR